MPQYKVNDSVRYKPVGGTSLSPFSHLFFEQIVWKLNYRRLNLHRSPESHLRICRRSQGSPDLPRESNGSSSAGL